MYYKGALPGVDNLIYFKSDVQLKENDVVVLNDQKYFIQSIENGLLLLLRVGSIVTVSV
ncbi:hypothetical protein PUW24_21805 [Paenibacillus urinalis]|uniref:Uncharacterized protein n=2 Tax=Paenibacillus TaxID=44249 RepID=A0AAX3MSW3_9BACL|nr:MULTISPECIES: hypothetical protein [Paenibacillus]WDH80706.1 hypothetical protein PUW23_14210 [Paenibacillus urinalis]WDH96759.1 hypothetical protein PUW24_21805 [Paenibacillus urinalis]WDI00403.1 hypothetical protein PUW25_13955 [Paenibacillus urinalis]SDW72929.1 hypothetical protein SAMN05518848_102833 [Paenibacillus sp. PDC88]